MRPERILQRREPRRAHQGPWQSRRKNACPYGVEEGRIVRYRETKDGTVVGSLCNFDAQIKESSKLILTVDKRTHLLIEIQRETPFRLTAHWMKRRPKLLIYVGEAQRNRPPHMKRAYDRTPDK
jgi:hypothetical protein